MKNRIIKKALSALLTVALILGALPAVALIANAAEPDFEVNSRRKEKKTGKLIL